MGAAAELAKSPDESGMTRSPPRASSEVVAAALAASRRVGGSGFGVGWADRAGRGEQRRAPEPWSKENLARGSGATPAWTWRTADGGLWESNFSTSAAWHAPRTVRPLGARMARAGNCLRLSWGEVAETRGHVEAMSSHGSRTILADHSRGHDRTVRPLRARMACGVQGPKPVPRCMTGTVRKCCVR